MSLFDLPTFVSKEDFADAHEPLNDGVKKVPNAQTVAASTKTGDVGTDTNSSGPAKIVPEKEDTDDVTKTEHNTVKESAEKPGAKPSTPATPSSDKPAPAPKDSGDDSKSKPFPPKSDKVDEGDKADDDVKEPLAHDTEKATKDEIEKTEKAKTALEAFAPRAKTFDIIGYPKVQAERVQQMVTFVHHRSGRKAPSTLSLESINTAIQISQERLVKLERDLGHFAKIKVSVENAANVFGFDTPPVEVPTETGGELLPPVVAEGITDLETDPLDVPMLEINRVQETVQALTEGAVAIEQFIQIIRANPRMSKQAAAVLQAGLEHIDRTCSLKVRATGMESYLTTPRAAMEEAEVSEKSLTDRASEIGAKILKWLREMMAKAVDMWERYKVGLDNLKDKASELKKKKFRTEGTIVLSPAPARLFVDGDFYGSDLLPEEHRLPAKLKEHYSKLTKDITRRVRALLTKENTEDIIMVMDALKADSGPFADLPGEKNIAVEHGKLVLVDNGTEAPEKFEVDVSDLKPAMVLNQMVKSIEDLERTGIIEMLKTATTTVTDALIKYRKEKGKDLDEAEFQKVQQAIVDNSIKVFDVEGYFEILKYVGSVFNARYKFCEQLVSN